MSRLGFVIVFLGAGLAVLMFAPQNSRIAGLTGDQIAQLVYLTPIIALMGAGTLASRTNWRKHVNQILIWLAIILVIAALSLFTDDAKHMGARLLAGLLPGHAVTITDKKGRHEVILSRNISGHFTAVVTVNAQDIPMLIDTGASTVTLTYDDAVQVGIIPENLVYSARVLTANGETVAAPIDLTMVQIGPIKRENVRALVTRQGAMEQSLLGMSFLTTLSSLHMKSDELRLKD